MNERRYRILYAVLAWCFFLAGTVFNAVLMEALLDVGPDAAWIAWIDPDAAASLPFLIVAGGLLLILAASIYVISLDPFRRRRPRILLFLQWLPASAFVAVLAAYALAGPGGRVEMPSLSAGIFVALAGPLTVLILEVLLGKFLRAVGNACEERGWNVAGHFFLFNSLRWKPGDVQVLRRCGLLLAEAGRFDTARMLLERLGPVGESEDLEVIRALERIYRARQDREAELACLERHRELRPEARGIDRRLLEQYLALERWDEAIALLESDRLERDLETMATLQQVYLKTGNIAQALARARQIARLEQPPYDRSIAMHQELLEAMPDNVELLIDLGLLLQKTELPERMEEGARHLERVLEIDPRRLHLRRQLAGYYQATGQLTRAEKHYDALIEAGDLDPETYWNYIKILRSEMREEEVPPTLERMMAACGDEQGRVWYEKAVSLCRLDRLEQAEQALAEARRLWPDDDPEPIQTLERRIRHKREEASLNELSEKMQQDGADLAHRLEYVEQLIDLDHGERAVQECDAILDKHPELQSKIQQVVEEGLKRAQHGYRLMDYLADLYFREGKYDRVLEMHRRMAEQSLHADRVLEEGCRRILCKRPAHAAARVLLGKVYLRSENWEAVLKNYENLIEQPPAEHARTIREQWTLAAYRAGRHEEAVRTGLRLLPEKQDDVEFQRLMIRILEDNGQYQQAFEVFKQAIERFPEDAVLKQMEKTVADNKKRNRLQFLQDRSLEQELSVEEHLEKADLHREFGQNHLAIIHYQRAAEDETWHDLAVAKLAIALCERRLFELADETLDAIELTREKVARHRELKLLVYRVADILASEQYHAAAVKYFKRIFRVDASFRDVVARLEKLGGAEESMPRIR